MKATLIKSLGKTFIKSDYNKDFIEEIKNKIPPGSRRWNKAVSTGLFFRLVTKIPREKLLFEESIISDIKKLCTGDLLKKTWEIDNKFYSRARDICLKHFLEVYESENGKTQKIIASNTMNYEKINSHQDSLLKEAEKYRQGKTVSFQWKFQAESVPNSKKDDLNFQFYCAPSEKWIYATSFSFGPKKEIGPGIFSQTKYFKGEKTEEGYSYSWEGLFYCPKNTIFKFKEHFYLVTDENSLDVLGEGVEGWTGAKQIEEYQKILLRLNEIINEKDRMNNFLRENPVQITDMEFPEKPLFPISKTIEITENTP